MSKVDTETIALIPDYMKCVPGRKVPYKFTLEEEEEAVWKARANPVIRDGGKSVQLVQRHGLQLIAIRE